MVIIAPSLLAADFSQLAQQIKLVEQAGAKWLHIDIMDGHFVPNLTLGPGIVQAIRKITDRFLDVHLMVEEPDFLIPKFREAGADLLTIHVEAMTHLHRSIQLIKQSGALAGISLNPATPVTMIEPILSEIDLVLVMSVNPGFGGQSFIPSSLAKLARINEMIKNQHKRIYLEIDGGINLETASLAVRAGANVLVAGTAIFRQEDIARAFHQLKDSISHATSTTTV